MTGRIAPHQHREIQLVLGGLKPLATIEKDKDCSQYSLAIALSGTGALKAECLNAELRDGKQGEVVFTLPHNKKLIKQYKRLLTLGPGKNSHRYHYLMGKLFGYTDEDIEAFIKADLNCHCKKCRG